MVTPEVVLEVVNVSIVLVLEQSNGGDEIVAVGSGNIVTLAEAATGLQGPLTIVYVKFVGPLKLIKEGFTV
jgi:hypothetical protein